MKTIDTCICITESLCCTPQTNTTIVSDSLWPHGLYSLWSSPSQNAGVGSHSLLQGIFLTQGSNLGLLHCRQILYHLHYLGSQKSESRSVVSDSLRLRGLYSLWNSPSQNTGVGSHSFLQGIFPIQGLNPGLPHFREILYQLSHKGSPRILEWVAHPVSRGSFRPRNRIGVSCIAGGFFINWAIREPRALYFLLP